MTDRAAEIREAEKQRILAEYRRREREIPEDRYAPWSAGDLFLRFSRARAAVRMLKDRAVFPKPGDPCLEIGYGSLGWLAELLSWGLRAADLSGIELDPRRAEKAQAAFPGADLRVGDATALPWPDGAFRLVVVSTVFSSVLDLEVQAMLAREIHRVLASRGALLWYDFAVDNPRNRNVRGVPAARIQELFPRLVGASRPVTLLPPLARRIAPWSWTAATLLEAFPPLRTHRLAVLVKEPAR